jgi:pilus assembly protein CpaE
MRHAFEQVEGVRVVGEFSAWEELQRHLTAAPADAIAVHLDGSSDRTGLSVVQSIIEVAPACPVVGVSRSLNPDSIIAAMRAGCAQFVRWPIDLDDLRTALGKLRTARGAAAKKREPRRICIVGASGAAGATTLACNLALALADVGGVECALVDLHLEFGDLAAAFDARPRQSLADVCRAGADVEQALHSGGLHRVAGGVRLLPRPERVDDAAEVTVESLRRTLAVLRERYPFVLIDLPRGGDLFAAAALQDADHVLIVTQATVPSLRNATRLQQGLMAGGVRRDSIGVVLNRYDANHAHLTSAEIEKHLGKPLFALVPNDYDRVTASSEWGRPIHLYAPESPVRPAVVQMARRIAGIGQEPEDTPVRGRGLISRLFGRAVAGSGPRP